MKRGASLLAGSLAALVLLLAWLAGKDDGVVDPVGAPESAVLERASASDPALEPVDASDDASLARPASRVAVIAETAPPPAVHPVHGVVFSEPVGGAGSAPLEGAQVDLLLVRGREWEWLDAATTDEKGEFAFAGHARERLRGEDGEVRFAAVAAAAGHEPRSKSIVRPLDVAREWSNVPLTLPRGPSVTGTVVDTSGAPEACAVVEIVVARRLEDGDEIVQREASVSGAGGRFRIALGRAPPGAVRQGVLVVRSADGRAGCLELGDLALADGRDVGSVLLAPPALLTGRVVTTGGAPLPRCGVMALHAGLLAPPGREPARAPAVESKTRASELLIERGRTDAGGRFRLEGLAAGAYSLLVLDPAGRPHPSADALRLVTSPLEARVTAATPTVSVRVTSGDCLPAPGAILAVLPAGAAPQSWRFVPADAQGVASFVAEPGERVQVITFADGRCSARRALTAGAMGESREASVALDRLPVERSDEPTPVAGDATPIPVESFLYELVQQERARWEAER